MDNKNNNRLNEQRFSEAEAGKVLGVSAMTIRRRREDGQLGYYQIGSRIYISSSHIEQFLEKNEVKASISEN